MEAIMKHIEGIVRSNIDENANVVSLNDANISVYLSSSYYLYRMFALGREFVIAEPKDYTADASAAAKGAKKLESALGLEVVLYLHDLPRQKRRALIALRRGFLTREGDMYLPSLAISFVPATDAPVVDQRSFSPAQQIIFLFCLYNAKDGILQADIQEATGLSAGSVSSALSLFVDWHLLECTVGGRTGRQRRYYIRSVADYYKSGIEYFGDPVKERLIAPMPTDQEGLLLGGLSALSARSDLVDSGRHVYALSPKQAKDILGQVTDSSEYCGFQILKYDPLLFSNNRLVDPVTMLLTIDEDDERIRMAIKEAMKGYEWYRG